MTTTQILKLQLDFVYTSVEANTAGMSAEDSLAAPESGGNCANWILGHLTHVQNRLHALLGAAPAWIDESLERDWDEPIDGPDTALDFMAMREAFLDSKARCLEAMESQTPEALAEDGFPSPFGGMATREWILAVLTFHQAYHAGQLAVARRVAGYAGVFKQPGS